MLPNRGQPQTNMVTQPPTATEGPMGIRDGDARRNPVFALLAPPRQLNVRTSRTWRSPRAPDHRARRCWPTQQPPRFIVGCNRAASDPHRPGAAGAVLGRTLPLSHLAHGGACVVRGRSDDGYSGKHSGWASGGDVAAFRSAATHGFPFSDRPSRRPFASAGGGQH